MSITSLSSSRVGPSLQSSNAMLIPSATTSPAMPLGIRYAWFVSLCLVSGVAWAEEPQVYPQGGSNVFLGLDDTSAPTQVQDGRAVDLQNVKLDISRGLRQRFGYSVVCNTLDELTAGVSPDEDECPVTGLYYTKFSSGTERIVATCSDRFYYLNGTTWDTVSGVNVAQTAGQNNQFVWATALDEIIGTNNVNPPIRYNGTALDVVNLTSLTASSRPTTAKTVAFFKNFLIFGNTTENGVAYKTRFRWSNVGTTNTWTDADYVDIGALSGQEINAMGGLSASRLQYAVSTDTNTDYYLCATNGAVAVNNLCLDFQYQLGEWTKHTNIPANALAHVLDNNGRNQNYFGSYEAFVYEMEDADLIDDVGTATGIVTVTNRIDTDTATGLQVVYTSGQTYTVDALAGAPILITEGSGEGDVRTLAGNTTTGLIVTDDFTTAPDATPSFEVGAIDSFYTTKWYDFGQTARLKHFGEVY